MKKNFFKSLCFSLAMLTITACSEDEYLDGIETEIEIPAEIECLSYEGDVNSRTFISEGESYEDGYATLWRTDEVIGVYGTLAKNSKFTSTNDEYAENVSFKGLMLGTPKYAYYPFSEQNDRYSASAVKATMPLLHQYSSVNKDLEGDFRIGTLDSRNWYSSKFTFTRMMSTLKFVVDATDTELQGSKICNISMKVNNNRKITGDFTMNLQNKSLSIGSCEEDNDSLSLKWLNAPALKANKSYVAYCTALPTIKAGDEITLTITTTTHKAVVNIVSKDTYKSNGLYVYDLTLKEQQDIEVEDLTEDNEEDQPVVNPDVELVIKGFKFTVENNPGKILKGKVIAGQTYNETITEEVCKIDEINHKISLNLPYLNNRKLVPTYDIPEGCFLITEDGMVIVSGETEVDFTIHKQLAVVDPSFIKYVIYDIELTNTNLPVVVINQGTSVTSTESNSDYKKASEAWYAATKTQWVPKDGPWTVDKEKGGDISRDNFMVYNADGTPAITDENGAILSEPIFSGTRLRGNVTQQMPKKAFAVKLKNKSGVLDMKPHKRWVLLANWKDRTLMRNAVAFGIAKKFKEVFPNDGIEWNPSGQHVELVYNGVHVGNYYLCEQIKIDGNRLDINDPYKEGDAFTAPEDYGYLLECDDAYDETWKFTTANYIPFLFKDDANQEMLDYATTFVRGIEDKLYAGNYTEAYKSMDLTSMVDFLLIQELMMNSEMKHPKSCYTYINDGKFYAGPIWDFDWNTLPTSTNNSEEGYSYTKSMLEKASCYHKRSGYPDEPIVDGSGLSGMFSTKDRNYMWYPMLVKDVTFQNLAAERWNAVKGALQTFVSVEIPQIQAKIADSDKVNNEMWPIDIAGSYSTNAYGMGGGKCGDESYDFSKAISTLQSTLNTRINGMSYVSNMNWPSISYSKK